jgi:hypothetical protein
MEQEKNEDKLLIEQVKRCALACWSDTYPEIWALEVKELRPDHQERRWHVLLEFPLPEEEIFLGENTDQFWTGVRLTSTGQLRIEKAGEYTQGTLDQFYQRLREGQFQQLLQEREAGRKQAGETDWQEGEIPF